MQRNGVVYLIMLAPMDDYEINPPI
jgi:hypothetical protein